VSAASGTGPAPGVRLHVERRGTGPPLLVLHGFTGSARAMQVLTDRLVERFTVIAPDLVGHGLSDAPADVRQYSIEAAADHVVDVVGHSGPVGLVGYSMGGRLGLWLCATRPDLISGALLIGASPGVAGEEDRARRRRADEALADSIESGGVASFVAEWEALPMWASQRSLPTPLRAAQRAVRLANTPIGLANSLRGMGSGAQPSLWDHLPSVQVPTCLVVGAEDPAFAAVARRMAESMPAACVEEVAGAGHAAHLECPESVAALVERHLASGSSGHGSSGQSRPGHASSGHSRSGHAS
jgi:2-succinyl-6-hydroxy-2,4-cyclohexadiene-1-carboxylate synthase